MELGHVAKHSPTTRERKASQGKDLRFFRLETLKNFVLNEKCYAQMTTIKIFFLQIKVHFFQFSKMSGGDLPLPPSSYAPASYVIVL